MIVLIAFAFVAGIVTILSPCILPVLPIVLGSSAAGGKRRPFGIVAGFVLSFTVFTLFLTSLVKALGISPDSLRLLSVVVIFVFGVSLLLPRFQALAKRTFSGLSRFAPKSTGAEGFLGGLAIGISIGLIWTPCVGPILASVIALALTGEVTGASVAITFSYSLGTAGSMLVILFGGRRLLQKVPILMRNAGSIQKGFGILMILTAIGIHWNYDRKIQSALLDAFPQYGTGLTKIEENRAVQRELQKLRADSREEDMGKPMFDVLKVEGTAPELIPGGEWLNSEPLSLKALRGKVVLIDFWTYTCINCIRTLPYLRSWHAQYADAGLVIIGVHTPEFEFEKNLSNLREAVDDFGLTYPVMQDNDYATWRAYDNRYWPAKYLIDAKGNIRYRHFGEGAYDETEEVIRTLLAEAGGKIGEEAISNPIYSIQARTPELYLGYARSRYLASPQFIARDAPAEYSTPSELPANAFAFTGTWEVGSERANPSAGATLKVNFEAKDVFLVMRPKDGPGTVRVKLDGILLAGSYAGEDVTDGQVVVDSDRLYRLIRLGSPGPHILELEFLDENLELYAFTFG